MDFIKETVAALNGVLWSYVLIVMLIGLGVWFTLRSNFVQLRFIKEMIRLITKTAGSKVGANNVSSFQAFCVSTASRVGVGNIAGIAIAVVTGGPGAIFWMWLIALIGSATGFVESTLGQIYKVPREGGGFLGGPAYYIKNVLGNKTMAVLFAILISVTYGLIFKSVQSNTMAVSFQHAFGMDRMVFGICLSALTAAVIFGGVNRIAKVAEMLVPFMAGIYMLVALYVTITNITLVPSMIADIFASAFGLKAVAGGGMGAALMTGIQRGLFSNEAGIGAVPNAAATATTSHPVKQGLIQAFGVFVDTLLVCSASAFIILLTKDYTASGKTGIELAQIALSEHIGPWASTFLAIMIIMFAFSSIVGNYYYGDINVPFINKSKSFMNVYRCAVILMVMFGSIAEVPFVWSLADLFMALMAVTNLIAIAFLGNRAMAALADYTRQKKAGIVEPEFDPSSMPDLKGIYCWGKAQDKNK